MGKTKELPPNGYNNNSLPHLIVDIKLKGKNKMLFSERLELAKKIDDYMEEKHIMQSTLGVVSVLQVWKMLAIPIEPPIILQKAGMVGDWEMVDKLKRECSHCKKPLHSAERKTILHGYERATICSECKTVHPQERFWNGR